MIGVADLTNPEELLEFLARAVPGYTVVTISSEIMILESLGIVSDEGAVSAMRTASLLVPPDTPATFRGLMNMLTRLIRMNPKFTDQHRVVLDRAVMEAGQIEDFQLTFGTLLPICRKLLNAKREAPGPVSPLKDGR